MKYKTSFFILLLLFFSFPLYSEDLVGQPSKGKVLDLNVRNSDLVEVLALLAMKGGYRTELGKGLNTKVNVELRGVTLEDAMEDLSDKYGLIYEFRGGTLYVKKKGSAALGSDNISEIKLRYTSALELSGKIDKFLDEGERLIVDERNNSLILHGSPKTEERLRSFIRVFDKMPKQIVIESQIVETSKNFLRDIGFGFGTIDNPALGSDVTTGGIVNAPGPTDSNLSLRKVVGSIDGATLAVKLAAAESSGTATIISRPKVITLNNRTAKIKSGITYHVKTLSAVTSANASGSSGSSSGTSGASGSSATVTGGLQTVEAGLQLDVTPTLVGEEMVQMTIVMNNSTPDKGLSVDGIPGINSSSADTSVVVQQGHTAILAGLVKTTDSLSKSGVPFLSEIPILGLLFASRNEEKRNNEIVIFMTPLIISSPEELNQTEHWKYRRPESEEGRGGNAKSGT